MKTLIPVVLVVVLLTLTGCAMLTAWKSIPPPGGCDQCHTIEIATNWKVSYQAATLSDERGQLPFQTPQYNTPIRQDQPASSMDIKKVEEQQCFVCHNAPTPAHKGRTGRFHH
jgi:hypothetical protein